MNIDALQLPSNWELCRVRDAYDFTKKPRGLDLKKNGDEIPFFTMDQIPIGKIRVSEFTLKPADKLGSGTYVENGDVDAGIVYSTDALISDKVQVIAEGPAEVNAQIVYPVAVIKTSGNSTAAKDYENFLFSDEAKAVFEKYGFVMFED